MSPLGPASTPAQSGLRLAGLLVVLAGLFAMHGLSGPGGSRMDMEEPPPAIMTVSSMSTDVSGLAAIFTGIVSDAGRLALSPAEDSLEGATGAGPGGMAMGAMCLAILGAALLALLRLLNFSRVAPTVWSLPRPAKGIVPRGRDPDPPSLIKLSIRRC